jgi:WD40 repeat protein
MQTAGNGTVIENGNGVTPLSNGCGDKVEREEVRVHQKRGQVLSETDSDIIRLIGQHLREMGLHSTLSQLVEESGCSLEHPKAAVFRGHVLAGEWEEASQAVEDLAPLLTEPSSAQHMQYLLLREKYLELLEGGEEMAALHCLRHELVPLPLHHTDKDIQTLTSYMMYSEKAELRCAANWPGVKAGSREQLMEQLQSFLPPSVMLPAHRLPQLLSQAVDLQISRCPYHFQHHPPSSSSHSSHHHYSLLTDHLCPRSEFPSETVHVLTAHSDEVWFLAFSRDGSRLASGAKDGEIILWDMQGDCPQLQHKVRGQADGIAHLAWSPDDSFLLSCGREDSPEAIVFCTQTGEVKCRVQHSAEDSLTCGAWSPDGQHFYVGGTRGQFLECGLDGLVSYNWEGIRVNALAAHSSPQNVYAADTHCRVRRYNFQDMTYHTLIEEDHPIMSFTVSRNGRHALLNVANQGVHVWDLTDRCLVRRCHGVTQGHYTIHSCYGGVHDSFVASGSEDGNVYVWRNGKEKPALVLRGHSRTVNCVAWDPVHHATLASASDDGTVRVWGREKVARRQRQRQSCSEHSVLQVTDAGDSNQVSG